MRATGLQGEPDVDIIEILDDDSDAFGDRSPHVTIHDTGGPRWIGPVATAALIALIGYGVATSASDGAPKVAPAPSTTAPASTTTVPEPTTTIEAPPPVPYYDADPPGEFSIQYADFQAAGSGYYGPGNYQLWATPGSSASTGSWFSIEGSQVGSSSLYLPDAYRVQAGERSMAITHMAGGQSVAQFKIDQSVSVNLTSFGRSDEELIRLAQSLTLDGDRVTVSDPSVITDHQMISTVMPWLAVQGIPIEQIYYSSTKNFDGGIGLAISQRQPSSQGGATLDRQIALRFFLDHSATFDVDGHVAVAGEVIGVRGFALASWIAGDHIVSISGYVPVSELITLARTVHKVTKDQWDGMRFQARQHSSENNFGDYKESPLMPVSVGTDAESEPWLIQAGIATWPNQQQVTWQWTSNGYGAPVDSSARINTIVEGNRTYVLANLPRAVAATGQLVITRLGLDPVVVDFSDTDPTLDRTLAAYAFSEATPYTAQILGPDGTVLAVWPS